MMCPKCAALLRKDVDDLLLSHLRLPTGLRWDEPGRGGDRPGQAKTKASVSRREGALGG